MKFYPADGFKSTIDLVGWLESRRSEELKADRRELRSRAELKVSKFLEAALLNQATSKFIRLETAIAVKNAIANHTGNLALACLSTTKQIELNRQKNIYVDRETAIKNRLEKLVADIRKESNLDLENFDLNTQAKLLLQETEYERYLKNLLVQKSNGVSIVNKFIESKFKNNEELLNAFKSKNTDKLRNFVELITQEFLRNQKPSKTGSLSPLTRKSIEWQHFIDEIINDKNRTENLFENRNAPKYIKATQSIVENSLISSNDFVLEKGSKSYDVKTRNDVQLEFKVLPRQGLTARIILPMNLIDKKAEFIAKFYSNSAIESSLSGLTIKTDTHNENTFDVYIDDAQSAGSAENLTGFILKIIKNLK